MERLTLHKLTGMYDYKRCHLSQEEAAKIYDRLAELEDELENGTLIKLPAPLDSELWTIEYPTHKHGKETVTVLSDTLATVEKSKYPLSFSNVEMVGKYYFITREEAEKRLEELKNAERKKV